MYERMTLTELAHAFHQAENEDDDLTMNEITGEIYNRDQYDEFRDHYMAVWPEYQK